MSFCDGDTQLRLGLYEFLLSENSPELKTENMVAERPGEDI